MNQQLCDPIQVFRDAHHRLAVMFAAGMTPAMVRRRTGYSHRRLTILMNTPMFVELIERYRKMEFETLKEDLVDWAGLKQSNALQAEQHIADRFMKLDEEGELMPVKDALAISQDWGDRFGFGKNTKQTVSYDFGQQLDSAIERSNTAKVIEHQPVSLPVPEEKAEGPAPSGSLKRRV